MTAAKTPGSRVVALDLTKGVLVVFMVLYHSLNYSTRRELSFEYMAFLPPSFIIITGFLISSIYLGRHSIHDWRLHARLLIRGAKLLGLFTILNVLAQWLIRSRARGQMPGVEVFFENWYDVYFTGYSRLAVFEVLLPIAYLLLVAPALLWMNRVHRSILPLFTFAVLIFCILLERNGSLWINVQFLSAGLIGMCLGRVPFPLLNRLARYRWAAFMLYAACFASGLLRGQTYLVQLLEASTALAFIYGFCVPLQRELSIPRRLDLLGRYSLLAYIAQIVVLNFLVRWTGTPELMSLTFAVLLLGTLALTLGIVEVTEWARRQSSGVNGLYKALFA